MLLKNLMEDKKLNLNQPLLSVRRHTPIMISQNFTERKPKIIPRYRTELKSGPVSNPGAVPFHWEQKPGQPKQDIKIIPQTHNSDKNPILDENIGKSEDGDEACVDALDLLSSLAKRYSFFPNKDEEEDESDDDEFDNKSVNLPSVCCLLPRFSLQSSVCILSPVPPMSVRSRVGISPVNRIQNRSSSACSLTEIENEASLENRSAELKSSENFTFLGETEETKRDGIKGMKTFQELLAEQESPEELDSSEGSVVEKTVYVDTVRNVDSSPQDFKNSGNEKCKLEMPKKEAIKITEKHPELLVPPPLPKSPSDSWLRRTITTKKIYVRSYPRSKGTISDAKWEAMIKSRKPVQRGDLHYSEDFLTAVPEI